MVHELLAVAVATSTRTIFEERGVIMSTCSGYVTYLRVN